MPTDPDVTELLDALRHTDQEDPAVTDNDLDRALEHGITVTWRPARPGDTPGELVPEHGPTQPIDADRIPLRHAELSTAGQLAQAQGRIRALEALRDRLTATVAGADTERDQARTDLGQALGQLTDAWAALDAAGYAHPVASVADLIRQCAADRDSTASRLSQARSAAHKLEVERDDLRIQLGRADADNRAMMRDRDEVIAERDKARRERDSLARRLGIRFGEAEEARAACRQAEDERDQARAELRAAGLAITEHDRIMQRAESVRIDRDGDLWRTAPDGQWTLGSRSDDASLNLASLEAYHGPTRQALLVILDGQDDEQDQDETDDVQAPGSGPARAQGQPTWDDCSTVADALAAARSAWGDPAAAVLVAVAAAWLGSTIPHLLRRRTRP